MEQNGGKLRAAWLNPSIAWSLVSLLAAAIGFGTLVLSFVRVQMDSAYYQIPAISAVILGLLSVSLLGFRSARRQSAAERQLHAALVQQKAVADNIPGVLFQWRMRGDGSAGFVYCSSRSAELFGFTAEEAIEDWRKLRFHQGDVTRWADSLRHSANTLENWFFEGRFVMPDGETKWWRGIAKPNREASGDIIFNGIMLDITDAKDAEREIKETRRNAERLGAEILMVNQSLNETNSVLQRINAQKNEILGIAAHDLKNPLGGVVGFAGSMRVCLDEEALEPYRAEMIDMAESIEQSARHMLHIINGLLNASALEDGAVTLEVTDCEMDQLVGSVISMNEPTAKRKGIALRFEAEAGCVVTGDPQRLQELVDNILSNAIKYSSAASTVWLKVSHSSPSTVQVSVRDEGPGLTADDMKKLFGKFQKLSARPTAGESSTGLGLAIAKSIVELHHGRIWAES
ncbi:MAG TPA: ATP-binding protein, partial [Opitutales bacterium]|nr:ATP-binding protein [Opitutales bacterium]